MVDQIMIYHGNKVVRGECAPVRECSGSLPWSQLARHQGHLGQEARRPTEPRLPGCTAFDWLHCAGESPARPRPPRSFAANPLPWHHSVARPRRALYCVGYKPGSCTRRSSGFRKCRGPLCRRPRSALNQPRWYPAQPTCPVLCCTVLNRLAHVQ